MLIVLELHASHNNTVQLPYAADPDVFRHLKHQRHHIRKCRGSITNKNTKKSNEYYQPLRCTV